MGVRMSRFVVYVLPLYHSRRNIRYANYAQVLKIHTCMPPAPSHQCILAEVTCVLRVAVARAPTRARLALEPITADCRAETPAGAPTARVVGAEARMFAGRTGATTRVDMVHI